MNLWKKVKHVFKQGASGVSEKTADIVDSSAGIVKEKLLKITGSSVDVEEVGKLQVELGNFRKKIKDDFAELGSRVYQLYIEGKVEAITEEIKQDVQYLILLNNELEVKEEAAQKAVTEYKKQSISRQNLKDFKEELEAAGGTLERLVVEAESPYIGQTLSEIEFPPDILVGLIVREDKILIPSGDTEIRAGDKVVLMGKKEQVAEVVYRM